MEPTTPLHKVTTAHVTTVRISEQFLRRATDAVLDLTPLLKHAAGRSTLTLQEQDALAAFGVQVAAAAQTMEVMCAAVALRRQELEDRWLREDPEQAEWEALTQRMMDGLARVR